MRFGFDFLIKNCFQAREKAKSQKKEGKIMKRSKLLFVAVLSLLLSLVAACSGTHLHSFSEWSITTDPTMEATGVYSQSCACGVVVEKEIPALSDTEVSSECPSSARLLNTLAL